MITDTPEYLVIPYEDYGRFNYVGTYDNGNQFLADVTGAFPATWWTREHTEELLPERWHEYKRWYAVLHRFDAEGNHLDTEVFSGGNSLNEDESCEKACAMLQKMLASIGPYRYGNIRVKLFSVKIEGYLFGLVYGTTEDSDVPDEETEGFVKLEPNDIMFHPPWDSGEYST